MTEEEAKTKMCPMMGFRPCLGSRCAAYEWEGDASKVMSGQRVIVDRVDADLLLGSWWDGRYARNKEGRLHRLIAALEFGCIPTGMFVDHIDGNPRNNRRGNLRIVTKAQNAANAAARGGKSRFRGVWKDKERWSAQIKSGPLRITLGNYDTEEEAAKAYDAAAVKVHGEHARLNLRQKANSGRHGFCGLAGKP